ncbi:MAG TPA: AAA family ATPase [Vicinamibacterales bacterium]|nr:AAA family ATPase [Vicinamibacterales bacterium]
MYEEYYGFTEKPFSLTPDPKYLFKSESHANAFELLQYAVRRREGFVVVTGDIGTGKTTLCRALLEQIDRNTFTALVLNPFLSEEDLLKLILQDFGVISREDLKRGRLTHVSKQELIETIYDFLLSLLPLRASAVLIIDEAQNLPMPVLEQIRILSNLETDKEKLLQIILVGQLNLQPLLKAPQMRQLDQRVSIRYQLRPLSRDEVAAYVSHRVNIAGASASVTFQPRALDMVHRRTKGIPRLVNLVCDRALLAAYSGRTNRVSPDIVFQAAESLELIDESPSRFGWFRRRASVYVAAAGASVSLAVAGGMALRSPSDAEGAGPVEVAAAAEIAEPQRIDVVAPNTTGTMPVGTSGSASARYAVLTASFPMTDVLRKGSAAATRYEAVVSELRGLGYEVRSMDVNLRERGEWRRVLVGEFATLSDANAVAHRVHQTPTFADAQVVSY